MHLNCLPFDFLHQTVPCIGKMFQPSSQESLILQPLKQLPVTQVLYVLLGYLEFYQKVQAQLPEKNIPQKLLACLANFQTITPNLMGLIHSIPNPSIVQFQISTHWTFS